jgi:ElaB/YqjD/DUF883 family membrane-anchored ribosome-binding protein
MNNGEPLEENGKTESETKRRKREIEAQLQLTTKELEDLLRTSDKKHKGEIAERSAMIKRAIQRGENSIGSLSRITKMKQDMFSLTDRVDILNNEIVGKRKPRTEDI